MNVEEFRKKVDADKAMLAEGITPPPGIQCCNSCRKLLQTFLTGRHFLDDGSQVCADCYDDELSAMLDENLITALRVSRHFKVGQER